MRLSEKIKPIRYLKANAAKLAEELKANGEAYPIIQKSSHRCSGCLPIDIVSVAMTEKDWLIDITV